MTQPSSSLFEMIVYVSYPYAINNLESSNKALSGLNKVFARLYRQNPNWCFVNGLFSTYNNPDLKNLNFEKAVFYHSKVLIDSASHVIIVQKPGWEYSEIVRNEGFYANHKNLPITYIETYE